MTKIIDFENEIWKDVIGFEGKYQVSSCGKIRSLCYRGTMGKVKELAICIRGGYFYVNLSDTKNGKRTKKYFVHRLVLCTFENKPLDYSMFVNHIDENKYNNNLTNLEWCTPKENINHGTCISRAVKSRLSKNDLKKYEVEKIERSAFNQLCKSRKVNPFDYTETWDDVSFKQYPNKKLRVYNYFYVGNGKGKRVPHFSIKNNNSNYKPIEHYETFPVSRRDFKRKCKLDGLNFYDFYEIKVTNFKKENYKYTYIKK